MSVHEPMATGELTVVRLPAETDMSNSSETLDGLLSTISRGDGHLVVDARDVRFMDSSGLNTLVRARGRTAAMGGSFHLVTASRQLLRLLEITRLERLLGLVATIEEAISCVASTSDEHVCGPVQPPV
ncbi:MAG: STAS domain-containing protein [Actinomycetes bacterium]